MTSKNISPSSSQAIADGKRQLAAIMFTDLKGYSGLTHADEAKALSLLEEHRSLVRPVLAEFAGIEVKTIGDAFLLRFESALDAVRCAGV